MGKSERKKDEKEKKKRKKKKKDLSWRESWGNGMLKQTERNPIKDIDVWLESRQVSLISFFVLVQKNGSKTFFLLREKEKRKGEKKEGKKRNEEKRRNRE